MWSHTRKGSARELWNSPALCALGRNFTEQWEKTSWKSRNGKGLRSLSHLCQLLVAKALLTALCKPGAGLRFGIRD